MLATNEEETEHDADYTSTLQRQMWLHLWERGTLLLYKTEMLRKGASNSTR